MEAIIHTTKGSEGGKISLPEKVFGLKWNSDLVHQVVTSMNMDSRKPYAHTKDRSEVRGGGKKPWQQKGLGRARHGSSRSPIWVGGGVAHGPRNEQNFDRKVNKKAKIKALFTILSKKLKDGEVLFVDSLDLKESKTKFAISAINSLSSIKGFERLKSKKKNVAVIAIPGKDAGIERSFSNISKVDVSDVRNINPIQLLNNTFIVMVNPKDSIKILESKI